MSSAGRPTDRLIHSSSVSRSVDRQIFPTLWRPQFSPWRLEFGMEVKCEGVCLCTRQLAKRVWQWEWPIAKQLIRFGGKVGHEPKDR